MMAFENLGVNKYFEENLEKLHMETIGSLAEHDQTVNHSERAAWCSENPCIYILHKFNGGTKSLD